MHLLDGFIGEFTGQLNAVANSTLFDSVPNTLQVSTMLNDNKSYISQSSTLLE